MKLSYFQNKINENRFLIIGRAGIDIYPEPPGTKTDRANNFVSHLGGSSANIAVALSKLGGKCHLLTCISDDALGRLAINHLNNFKVTKINNKKLKEIENVTSIPLVLHGGSGISNVTRKKLARNSNVAKFNIGTELRILYGKTARKYILENKRIYDRVEMLETIIKELKKLTIKIISNIGPLN